MNKQVVNQLVSEALSENNSLFLIDLSLHQDNKIVVQIDGDLGVPLKECIRISRFIENSLDKEVEDYALEVTTPDIADPIKDIRQYKKNLQLRKFRSLVKKIPEYDVWSPKQTL